eukprot:9315899-Pyramimonas_sp.AAC.1
MEGTRYIIIAPLFAQIDRGVVVVELPAHDVDKLAADGALRHGIGLHAASVAPKHVGVSSVRN